MASSGKSNVTGSDVWSFPNWWSEYDKKRHAVSYAPPDFFWWDSNGFVWWYMVENDATSEECGGYEIIDFEGGLFAVHTAIDGDDESMNIVNDKILKWLENTGFEFIENEREYPEKNIDIHWGGCYKRAQNDGAYD